MFRHPYGIFADDEGIPGSVDEIGGDWIQAIDLYQVAYLSERTLDFAVVAVGHTDDYRDNLFVKRRQPGHLGCSAVLTSNLSGFGTAQRGGFLRESYSLIFSLS